MVVTFPVLIFVGAALGYLAALGVGGGTLLMIWLTVFLQTDYATARNINLMFFLFCAGSVSFLRWRKGSLRIKEILPAVIAGSIATAIFTWVSHYLDPMLIRKIFGVLLIVTGAKELLYRPRKAR